MQVAIIKLKNSFRVAIAIPIAHLILTHHKTNLEDLKDMLLADAFHFAGMLHFIYIPVQTQYMLLVSPNCNDIMKPNIEWKEFPDGDAYIRIPGIKSCQGENITLIHRLYPNQNSAIFTLLMTLDTLRRTGAHTTVISPYFPYSRQDKTFLEGEALSAQLLCRLLSQNGAVRLITLDCHFLKKPGEMEYAGLKITNITANQHLIRYAIKKFGIDKPEIISPDQGANYLVSEFGGKSMSKVRGNYNDDDSKTQTYRQIKTLKMDFDVKGRNVIIIDDIIATGSTMIKAVENVKKGGAKKVICLATHGIFLNNSLEKLNSICDGIATTDSIPNPVATVPIKDIFAEFLSKG